MGRHRRSRRKNWKLKLALAIVCTAAALAGILLLGRQLDGSYRQEQAYSRSGYTFSNTRSITVNGVRHKLKNQLTTVLLMGIDRNLQEPVRGYRNGGQADFLHLVVIDHDNEAIWQIPINRNSMAEVTTLSPLGKPTSTRRMQLCLAHHYGDGREISCKNTLEAASRLLLNVPIDFYISMGFDGIGMLNSYVGGVTVTIPMDLTEVDPAFREGETVKLTDSQAFSFVRVRMGVGDGTNTARMERQAAFMNGLQDLLVPKLRASQQYAANLFDTLYPRIVTNMSKGRLVNELWNARNYRLEPKLSIPGRTVTGQDGYAEFLPDGAALGELLVRVFCQK